MMAHEPHYAEFYTAGYPAMQSFEPNHDLFGPQGGMEILGPPSKHPNSNLWRGFIPRDFPEASNKNFMVTMETVASASPWQVDDSSLRSVFPCEGTEQSSGGLSLSLFNPKPSDAIGVPQSFHQSDSRDVLLSRAESSYQQQVSMQEGSVFNSQHPFQLKHSKYLTPAKELLNEFCNLGGEISSKKGSRKENQREEGGPSSSFSSWNQSLNSIDLLELQKRKAKLLSMLEEVDRGYRKYCKQMRAVVASFESVAGEGAATVYARLASKSMSRHFRCLRDGIVGQVRATKKAIEEKDTAAPGTPRGETPRLKLLDQRLRQHKALQQAGMMESHPWRPQRGLPERSVSILRSWLFEHFLHPYPSDVDKHILARQTGLSRSQVSNWFINARVRLWKPMIEEMHAEEMKEQNNQSSHAATAHQENTSTNPNPNHDISQDQKPAPGQLLNDSDPLSSIINSNHQIDQKTTINAKTSQHRNQQQQIPRAENFGVDLDFSSYSSCGSQKLGSGVSLTLGLQQHNGVGMNLSFSPASQNSLLLSRGHANDGQQVQFGILDGETRTLPYRNMVGAQLLHDLAG